MILNTKHNHIAYRCPGCGYAIFGLVTPFTMAQGGVKLKCQCGESELTMQFTQDKKVHLTVPCLFCGQPHHYTVSQSLFLEKDLFLLSCPYTNMDIAFVGKKENVDEALSHSAAELEQLFAQLGQDEGEEVGQSALNVLPDAQIYDIIRFLITDLSEEGEISCPCESGHYECEVAPHGIRVFCPECGADHLFRAESVADAQEFLHCSHIDLLKRD